MLSSPAVSPVFVCLLLLLPPTPPCSSRGWQGLIAQGCHSSILIIDPKTTQTIQVLERHKANVVKVSVALFRICHSRSWWQTHSIHTIRYILVYLYNYEHLILLFKCYPTASVIDECSTKALNDKYPECKYIYFIVLQFPGMFMFGCLQSCVFNSPARCHEGPFLIFSFKNHDAVCLNALKGPPTRLIIDLVLINISFSYKNVI